MKIDFTRTITAEAKAERVKARELDRITARRNAALSSGATIGGVSIHTDDVSQQRIVGAALAATLDPEITVNWKCADGTFVTLDASTIIAIAQAVRAHVQCCFDREAELLDALAAGEAYDIDAGWPA